MRQPLGGLRRRVYLPYAQIPAAFVRGAGCHGLNAITGGVAPDLLKLDADCLDDFGLTRLDLVFRRNDGPWQRQTISRWNGGRLPAIP